MSNIANRLKLIRTDAGLKQSELAEKLGITLRAYQSYERGERDINTALLKSICELLSVSSDFLLGRVSSPLTESQERLAKLVEDTHPDGAPAAVSVTMGLDTKKAPPRIKREDAFKKLSSLSDDEFREVELFADFIEFRRNHQK